MMTDTQPTLVIGHRNPDTDAIAAALGYAFVLDTIAGTLWPQCARSGDGC